MNRIELLAPAKNSEYGKAAIDCGADAVYIGASKFGARHAAGNTAEEIASLADYAHRFDAKVYVTLNTLLFDDELAEAERLAWEVWETGADALIVQDMAFCRMKLPPIVLHASTQTANLTPERVKFLQDAGFRRVILERALSLRQIRDIRQAVDVELECFVHGAICVSYSGQCYLSHIVAGRSGNRGVCAQPCRSSYNLYDGQGNLLIRNKHLMSVKDLSLDAHLHELIQAGVTSLKIEGRLKDLNYLKNIVSHYDRLLTELADSKKEIARTAAGRIVRDFMPLPENSFNRSLTPYFFDGKKRKVACFDTAKATGPVLGSVIKVSDRHFTIRSEHTITNGDGICFLDERGALTGTQINRTEGNRIYPRDMAGLRPGTVIFRNFDKRFSDRLAHSVCRRVLDLRIELHFSPEGLTIVGYSDDGGKTKLFFNGPFEKAKDPEKARKTAEEQFRKSGDTFFRIPEITVFGEVPFLPVSIWNGFRRKFLDTAEQRLRAGYVRAVRTEKMKTPQIEATVPLTYKANITNRLAKRFYENCGYSDIETGVELKESFDGIEAMRSKYCLRNELGICLKQGKGPEKLYLENNRNTFELQFDCDRCEMILLYREKTCK